MFTISLNAMRHMERHLPKPGQAGNAARSTSNLIMGLTGAQDHHQR